MEVPDSMFVMTNENLVTIEEISKLLEYQIVSVRVKVVKEKDATEVKTGLIKQDGCCKVVTWEEIFVDSKRGS